MDDSFFKEEEAAPGEARPHENNQNTQREDKESADKRQHSRGVEFTIAKKNYGMLSKSIKIVDGRVKSDGSRCLMSTGSVRRAWAKSSRELRENVESLRRDEALILGQLKDGIPDEAPIASKGSYLAKVKGFYARTRQYIDYKPGAPALAMVDFDAKGMPDAVAAKIKAVGGVEKALDTLVPAIAETERLFRASTSSGLYNGETGEKYPASGGFHLHLFVNDGGDVQRFLYDLHDKAWAHGFGWHIVSKSGALLERSIVDKTVCAGERLDFEAPPELEWPLKQENRETRNYAGDWIDTATALRLTPIEQQRAKAAKAASVMACESEVRNKRVEWIAKRIAELIASGMTEPDARTAAEKWQRRVLTPRTPLCFDDSELAGKTVGDVLAAPDAYLDCTLADPFDFIEEGAAAEPNKAVIFVDELTGDVAITSFAHGGAVYHLRHDLESIIAAMNVDKRNAVDILARLIHVGHYESILSATEQSTAIEHAAILAGVNKSDAKRVVKKALLEKKRRYEEAQARRDAIADPRPTMDCPEPEDQPREVLRRLDDILCAIQSDEPPMRGVNGVPVRVVDREPICVGLHQMTHKTANGPLDPSLKPLPPPRQPLFTRLDRWTGQVEIDRHVCVVRKNEADGVMRNVALPPEFVTHWLGDLESKLPRVGTIVTAPVVLPSGEALATNGLDNQRKLFIRCDPALLSCVPSRKECTDGAVADAFGFLVDELFVDVAADFKSKAILVALMLTILQRALLPKRPAFGVVSGQSSSGKTTAIWIISEAVLGLPPLASQWAEREDERRKALVSLYAEGVPLIVFDNIKNGARIDSEIVTQACTLPTLLDRRLGVHGQIEGATTPPIVFTGNNIEAVGDLSSRVLAAKLGTDLPDPQNRPIKRRFPLQWVREHRAAIMRALYTILVGGTGRQIEPATRFPEWFESVGAPLEFAANVYARKHGILDVVSFKHYFDDAIAVDEQSLVVARVLGALAALFPPGTEFTATDLNAKLTTHVNEDDDPAARRTLWSFFDPESRHKAIIPLQVIGRRLGTHLDQPVRGVGDEVLVLKIDRTKRDRLSWYRIERKGPSTA